MSRPVRVECVSGHKSEERPLRFRLDDRWVDVAEIVERWVEAGPDPLTPITSFFRVLDGEGISYLLRQERLTGSWTLREGC